MYIIVTNLVYFRFYRLNPETNTFGKSHHIHYTLLSLYKVYKNHIFIIFLLPRILKNLISN